MGFWMSWRSERWLKATAGVGAVALLAACSTSGATPPAAPVSGSENAQPVVDTPSPTAAPAASVTFSIKNGSTSVAPSTPLKVAAVGGTLGAVTVKTSAGKAVAGSLGTDGVWAGRLLPKTAYVVSASATNADGIATTTTSKFTTLTPKIEATYRVWPQEGTVGVGMPVAVYFDSPVKTKALRAGVEKAIKLTVTPKQEGSWGWSTSTSLYYRPRGYWKPGTKVTVEAPLAGVQTGVNKWVVKDKSGGFTVGSSMISYVNLKTHRMVVKRNGQQIANYPISGGKPGAKTTTRSGIKIISAKDRHYTMDSASYGVKEGDPDYYQTKVEYAMRITNTGEFLHSAPWSVWAQGSRNVSHGCVNLGPRAARTMFNESKIGDVVETVGSWRQFAPGEGVDVWIYSWNAWKQRSAVTGNGGIS